MPNNCLVALAKSSGLLATFTQLIEFLELWHGVFKYANKIFLYLKINRLLLELEIKLLF